MAQGDYSNPAAQVTQSDLDALERAGFKQEGPEAWRGPCASAEHGGDNDTATNCRVWLGDKGFGAKCHSYDCSWESILRGIGLWEEWPVYEVRRWVYSGSDGRDRHVTRTDYTGGGPCRYGRNSGKPCGRTDAHKHISGPGSHRGAIARAFSFGEGRGDVSVDAAELDSRIAVVVEGEATAEAVSRSERYAGWTAKGGASHVLKSDWSALEGRDVVLWPDNDSVGVGAMRQMATVLREVASSLRIVDVSAMDGSKGDSSDAADMTTHDMESRLEQARELLDADYSAVPERADTRDSAGSDCACGGGGISVGRLQDLCHGRVALVHGAAMWYWEGGRKWLHRSARAFMQTELGLTCAGCLRLSPTVEAQSGKFTGERRQGVHPFVLDGELCVFYLDRDGHTVRWRDARAADYITEDTAEMPRFTTAELTDMMRGDYVSLARDFALNDAGFDAETWDYWCGLLKAAFFGQARKEIAVWDGGSWTGKGTLTQCAMDAFGAVAMAMPSGDYNRFSTHGVVRALFVRSNEGVKKGADYELWISLIGGEKVPCEVKGGAQYFGRFLGILVHASAAGLGKVDTSKGLGNRVRVFRTRKSPREVTSARATQVVKDGRKGMLFDILRADIPESDRLEHAPRQVQGWTDSAIEKADRVISFVRGNYTVGGEGDVVRFSEFKDEFADKLNLDWRPDSSQVKDAFEREGYAIDKPDSQRPSVLRCIKSEFGGCGHCGAEGHADGIEHLEGCQADFGAWLSSVPAVAYADDCGGSDNCEREGCGNHD